MAKYGALWGVADGQQEAMKLLHAVTVWTSSPQVLLLNAHGSIKWSVALMAFCNLV